MFDPKLGYCPLWEDLKAKFPFVRFGELKVLYKIIDKKRIKIEQLKSAFERSLGESGTYYIEVLQRPSKFVHQYNSLTIFGKNEYKENAENIATRAKKRPKREGYLSFNTLSGDDPVFHVHDKSPVSGFRKRRYQDIEDDIE